MDENDEIKRLETLYNSLSLQHNSSNDEKTKNALAVEMAKISSQLSNLRRAMHEEQFYLDLDDDDYRSYDGLRG